MLSDINFSGVEIWGHQTKKEKKEKEKNVTTTSTQLFQTSQFSINIQNSEASFLPHLLLICASFPFLSFPSLPPSLSGDDFTSINTGMLSSNYSLTQRSGLPAARLGKQCGPLARCLLTECT